MRHGDVELCESKAICTYIDIGFEGPPLVPRTAHGAALVEQWISLFNTAIDPVLARQYLLAYFFSGLPDGAPDRARIEASLPKMRDLFALLERRLADSRHLGGDDFTLADAFLLPLIHYMAKLPESGAMLRESPALAGWFDRVSTRPSAQQTVPPPMPSRS